MDVSIKEKGRKILYLLTAISVSAVFVLLLIKPIRNTFFEEDLWWAIPLQCKIMQNNSFLNVWNINLFNPHITYFGEPNMNGFFTIVLSLFGPAPVYFLSAALIIHFFCAALIFFIIRKMGLEFNVGLFSGLLYLTLFAHFQSYMWPMSAALHLTTMCIALVVILLYLETNQRMEDNKGFQVYRYLTLFANFIASFFQITILMLPAAIFAHILFCSRNDKDRLKKYDIWLPLFITYFGYMLLRLVCFSRPNFTKYLAISQLGSYFDANYIKGNVSVAAYCVFFIAGISCLLLFRYILSIYQRYPKYNRSLLWFIIFAVVLLISQLAGLHHKTAYLINPLNFIRPFASMLSCLLHPIEYALSINSAWPYHYIPIKAGAFDIILSVIFLIIFFRCVFFKKKALIIFLVLYMLSLRLTFKSVAMPSRYFMYTSPILCVIFSSSVFYAYGYLMNKIKLKHLFKDTLLCVFFIFICVSNVLAINLEIIRGRLANNFLIYDYIKAATLIKANIAAGTGDKFQAQNLYVNNVFPMPFECWEAGFINSLDHDNFRYVAAQVLQKLPMHAINVNTPVNDRQGYAVFNVNGKKVQDAAGADLEPFYQFFGRAMQNLEADNQEGAVYFFKKAAMARPFLLNYILGSKGLDGVSWITGGLMLRKWLNEIINSYKRWGKPAAKIGYLERMLNDEITDYATCLFYLSYANYISGNLSEAQYWRSQLYFIDRDFDRIISTGDMPASNNKMFLDFLEDGRSIRPARTSSGFILWRLVNFMRSVKYFG